MVVGCGGTLFVVSFLGALLAAVTATWWSWKQKGKEVRSFKGGGAGIIVDRALWLLVFLPAVAADWLMGPYLWALYREQYGYEPGFISGLYAVGFLSSLLFGTIVSTTADHFGRKKLSLCFGPIYAVAALVKLTQSWELHVIGHILSGCGTSLLFSSFEACMVGMFLEQGHGPFLHRTFELVGVANSVVAILSGVGSTFLVESYGSYTGVTEYRIPFLLSAGFAMLSSVLVAFLARESYGSVGGEMPWDPFVKAVSALRTNGHILVFGLAQSLFEAAMYCFVFIWAPALGASVPSDCSVPFGWIFATFMLCMAFGNSLSSILLKSLSLTSVSVLLTGAAAVCYMIASLALSWPTFLLTSFLGVEVACGVFFPVMGSLRVRYVPEESRAAVMSLFRVPTNALVALLLAIGGNWEAATMLRLCFVGTLASMCLLLLLPRQRETKPTAQ